MIRGHLVGVLLCAVLFALQASARIPSSLEQRTTDVGKDLRIMPLGASITFGWKSSTGNGYRAFLQKMLTDKGYKVTYVGSQSNGDMADNKNEGYPGATISEVDDHAANSGVYGMRANVVLLNAGTNDCQGPRSNQGEDAPSDYSNLLDHISTRLPNALIVASSLLPNLDDSAQKCIRKLNPRLQKVVDKAQAKGQHVVWVDMFTAVPTQDIDQDDGTHPHDNGYRAMAKVWFDGLIKAASDIKGTPSSTSAMVATTLTPSSTIPVSTFSTTLSTTSTSLTPSTTAPPPASTTAVSSLSSSSAGGSTSSTSSSETPSSSSPSPTASRSAATHVAIPMAIPSPARHACRAASQILSALTTLTRRSILRL